MKLDPNVFAKMLIDFLRPTPTKVIHNNEHTIILFDDGSKTVTKPNGNKYDPYIGFCVAMTAKYFGGKKAAHQAYESLSGCKYGTQPDEVADLAERIASATNTMNRLAETLRQANISKQTEPKAEPLQKLEGAGKYCNTCEYFNVSLNLEPCKSCIQIRTTDNRYPKWTAPLQTSNEQMLTVDGKEGEPLGKAEQMCKKCIFKYEDYEDDLPYCSYLCNLTEVPINCKYFEKKEVIPNV